MSLEQNIMSATHDIAIVICTYNPEERLFARTLKAVEQLEIPKSLTVECVIVDNNSSTPLIQLSYVKDFLESCSWAKVITESKQGLSYARITGFKSTTSPIIILFDDDNEPDKNYLKAAVDCLNQYHCLAALGPGKVNVEFIDPVSDWVDKNLRGHFQEKFFQHTQYGCVMENWMDFYPLGTGLVVKREALEKYCQEFAAGRLASSDRKGSSLSSGGDLQIVWEAVKMGFAAGSSPELQITHLVPGKRSNLKYVMRLSFGATSSYVQAIIESFPSEKEKSLETIPSNIIIFLKMIIVILTRIFKSKNTLSPVVLSKLLLIDLAKYTGEVVGTLRAAKYTDWHWIYNIVKLLKLD